MYARTRLIVSGYPPDVTPAAIWRLFERCKVPVSRVQLLVGRPDARGRLAAFAETRDEADAAALILAVKTGGGGGLPLAFEGDELAAAYWDDDRPPHLAGVPRDVPDPRRDDVVDPAASRAHGQGQRPGATTRSRFARSASPMEASYRGATNAVRRGDRDRIDRDRDFPPEYFERCPAEELGRWERPNACVVDARSQMGRVIGPKGETIKRLRAESGASIRTDDARDALIVEAVDGFVAEKGARAARVEVARWLEYARHGGRRPRERSRCGGGRGGGADAHGGGADAHGGGADAHGGGADAHVEETPAEEPEEGEISLAPPPTRTTRSTRSTRLATWGVVGGFPNASRGSVAPDASVPRRRPRRRPRDLRFRRGRRRFRTTPSTISPTYSRGRRNRPQPPRPRRRKGRRT